MTGLIKSEVLKIRSTQVWLWMLLLSVALTALGAIGPLIDARAEHTDYYRVFTAAQLAQFALLVLGVLGMTTEFRHKTITPTLLATPNRWRLLGAKAISYLLFAAVYGLICAAFNIAMAVIWLSAKNVDVSFGHGVVGGIVKAFINLALMGLFGLGLGAIVRNQAAGMVIGLVYFFVIDNLIEFIPKVQQAYPYTPGGASTAFTSNGGTDNVPDAISLLNPLVGGVVFAAWALGLVLIGGMVSLRRDIS